MQAGVMQATEGGREKAWEESSAAVGVGVGVGVRFRHALTVPPRNRHRARVGLEY